MDIFRLMRTYSSSSWGLIFVLLFCLSGCAGGAESESGTYIFLGHPYDWNDPYRLDPRLERLDFSRYDQVWLGGDVCSRTTEQPETLVYLDSLLDFSGEHVQWTLGNHDIQEGNVELITDLTGKPTFYSLVLPGDLQLIVLNTNLFWMWPSAPPQEECAVKQAQMDLLTGILDTIDKAAQLVILHHHSLLKEMKPDSLQEVFNMDPGTVALSCHYEDQFSDLIYPRLVAVQKRGIEVIMVGGDLGMRVKSFSYQTPEGIWLLGSGINNSLIRENAPEYVTNFDPDQVLLFHHDRRHRKLEWEFVPLDKLTGDLAPKG